MHLSYPNKWCFWYLFFKLLNMFTRQMELRPPEKQISNFDVPLTFIVFYKVSRHLYSIFLRRHYLQIGSFLCNKTEDWVLHFLQIAAVLCLRDFYSSTFDSYLLGWYPHFWVLHFFSEQHSVWFSEHPLQAFLQHYFYYALLS